MASVLCIPCPTKCDHYRQRGPFQKLAFQKEKIQADRGVDRQRAQITWESSAAQEALY